MIKKYTKTKTSIQITITTNRKERKVTRRGKNPKQNNKKSDIFTFIWEDLRKKKI